MAEAFAPNTDAWTVVKFSYPYKFYSSSDLNKAEEGFKKDLAEEGLHENVDYVISVREDDALTVKFLDGGAGSFYLMHWIGAFENFNPDQ